MKIPNNSLYSFSQNVGTNKLNTRSDSRKTDTSSATLFFGGPTRMEDIFRDEDQGDVI